MIAAESGFIYEGRGPYFNGYDDSSEDEPDDHIDSMEEATPDIYMAAYLEDDRNPSPSKRKRCEEIDTLSDLASLYKPCSDKENKKNETTSFSGACPNVLPNSITHQGHTYNKKTASRSNRKKQWTAWYSCSQKRKYKCLCTLQLYVSDAEPDYVQYKACDIPHSCPPISTPFKPVAVTSAAPLNLREEMKHELETRACLPGALPPKEMALSILMEFENKYADCPYVGLTLEQLRRLYYRIRETEFANWTQAISTHPLVSCSDTDERMFLQFHNKVNVDNRLLNIIGWAHPDLMWEIRDGSYNFFFDLTFYMVPKGFDQCFIIMAYLPKYECYVPIFYILVQSKLQEVYEHALHGAIAATGHRMGKALTKTCDFESGLMNAVEMEFPDGDMICCEFHFKQANRRKLINELHLDKKLVAEFMQEDGLFEVLTVIPPAKIDKFITYIRERSPLQATYPAKMEKFWTYFKNQWCKPSMIPKWNVYDILQREDALETVVNRTNNPLERHNRELKEMFQNCKPTMELFVTNIRKMSSDKVDFLNMIKKGKARPPPHLGLNVHQIPADFDYTNTILFSNDVTHRKCIRNNDLDKRTIIVRSIIMQYP